VHRHSDWNHYEYTYGEGAQARVDFDVMAAVVPGDDGANCLRVVVADDGIDAVESLLASVDGRLVGTLRYAGQHEWVVWTDVRELSDELGRALAAAGAKVAVLGGHDYANDRIFPTPADWRRIEDREALERLDLDGDGALRVLHRFVGPEAGLAAVAERLAPEAFTEVETGPERRVLAHEHPIGQISDITLGLMRLCEAHGVAYDGWVLPG